MNTTGKIIFGILVLIIAGLAFWYFITPLFLNREVQEDFDFAIAELEDMEQSPSNSEGQSAQNADTEIVGENHMTISDETSAPTGLPDTPMPRLVSSGEFQDADDFHQGSGQAAVIVRADGSAVVRFEDFEVTNGPDLRVYVSTSADPQTRQELSATGTNIGRLKGNRGNQTYELPDDIDPDDIQSIVIYCQPFHVFFSTATLQ